jgi:transcriptional regulator with XRE-family HTH domain
MVKIEYTAEARRVQSHRRRVIEQRRKWGAKVVWPAVPERGWLAEVRAASGLSTRDVAVRLGIDQSAVVRAEASERTKSLRLAALVRYAEAIDADVHYVVIPRASVLDAADSTGRRRRQLLRLRAVRSDSRYRRRDSDETSRSTSPSSM